MAKARKKVQARRRSASRKPAGRKATARRTAKANVKARPKHKFTVSHHRDEDFDQGLRTYAKYRDLAEHDEPGRQVAGEPRAAGALHDIERRAD
jgi:hypothetical protein